MFFPFKKKLKLKPGDCVLFINKPILILGLNCILFENMQTQNKNASDWYYNRFEENDSDHNKAMKF